MSIREGCSVSVSLSLSFSLCICSLTCLKGIFERSGDHHHTPWDHVESDVLQPWTWPWAWLLGRPQVHTAPSRPFSPSKIPLKPPLCCWAQSATFCLLPGPHSASGNAAHGCRERLWRGPGHADIHCASAEHLSRALQDTATGAHK